MNKPILVTAADASALLSVGETRFYQLRAERADFPTPVMLGPRCIRYRTADIEAFVERLASESAPQPEPVQLAAGRSRGQARRKGRLPFPAQDMGCEDDVRPIPTPAPAEVSA
ncbi:helix-turn-helix transcriptional regulator [Zeimonas arvi]|uniref:Helix-turn-helix domain-containing protein n=1 Tax=Zeimonas arvi TaxID=2498847 RepID=A0A5C8NL64_9BURK|nr:helix-turn-helix domain-containing protein [Zeimonas arvi]TXL62459.1 helix-turn-helix domain-containing protein [Zeimonas arvi]